MRPAGAATCWAIPPTDAAAVAIGADSALHLASCRRSTKTTLEPMFPCKPAPSAEPCARHLLAPAAPAPLPAYRRQSPRSLIPVFPGTNCEYDTARAVQRAGVEPEILVVRNLTAAPCWPSPPTAWPKAIRQSQMVILPGGFSGGDEPDGSGKFITAFFRNPQPSATRCMDLLKQRDGLMLGICNGFQALIKLGLVPYGEIRGHGRRLPHPDLQRHRPPPVQAGAAPGWPPTSPPG